MNKFNKKNQRHGTWEFRSHDSRIMVNYKNGIRHGELIEFFEHDIDKIERITEYVDGKRNGKFITYDVNGLICIISHYKNNILNGEYIEYSGNNTIFKGEYVNNLLEGKFEQFSSNNNIFITGYHKNGLKTGLWIRYNINGTIKDSQFYSNGKLVVGNDDSRNPTGATNMFTPPAVPKIRKIY